MSRLVPPSLRGSGQAAIWRRARIRRLVAAGMVAAAGWIAIEQLSPAFEDDGRVVVTMRADRSVGHLLAADDLEVRRMPEDLVPATALADPADGIGRVLVAPVSAGEVVTLTRVRLASTLPPLGGMTRAVHIPLVDPGTAGLLTAGDRVDVIAVATGEVVAEGLSVLLVDQARTDDSALGMATSGQGSAGVVLATPRTVVGPLTRAALGQDGTVGVHLALRSSTSGR